MQQVKQTAALFAENPDLSRVLTIDTFYEYTEAERGAHGLIANVEDAVRFGVDAVKMLMPLNTTHTERTRLANRVGKVISACDYAFSLNRKRQVASKWAETIMVPFGIILVWQ